MDKFRIAILNEANGREIKEKSSKILSKEEIAKEQPAQETELLEIVSGEKKKEEMETLDNKDQFLEDIETNKMLQSLCNKEKIKNKNLREKFKRGLFNEARKRTKANQNSQFPKIDVRKIVQWTDKAILNVTNDKKEMIRKAFRITGICPLLEGEVLHDYHYIEERRRRVVTKKIIRC